MVETFLSSMELVPESDESEDELLLESSRKKNNLLKVPILFLSDENSNKNAENESKDNMFSNELHENMSHLPKLENVCSSNDTNSPFIHPNMISKLDESNLENEKHEIPFREELDSSLCFSFDKNIISNIIENLDKNIINETSPLKNCNDKQNTLISVNGSDKTRNELLNNKGELEINQVSKEQFNCNQHHDFKSNEEDKILALKIKKEEKSNGEIKNISELQNLSINLNLRIPPGKCSELLLSCDGMFENEPYDNSQELFREESLIMKTDDKLMCNTHSLENVNNQLGKKTLIKDFGSVINSDGLKISSPKIKINDGIACDYFHCPEYQDNYVSKKSAVSKDQLEIKVQDIKINKISCSGHEYDIDLTPSDIFCNNDDDKIDTNAFQLEPIQENGYTENNNECLVTNLSREDYENKEKTLNFIETNKISNFSQNSEVDSSYFPAELNPSSPSLLKSLNIPYKTTDKGEDKFEYVKNCVNRKISKEKKNGKEIYANILISEYLNPMKFVCSANSPKNSENMMVTYKPDNDVQNTDDKTHTDTDPKLKQKQHFKTGVSRCLTAFKIPWKVDNLDKNPDYKKDQALENFKPVLLQKKKSLNDEFLINSGKNEICENNLAAHEESNMTNVTLGVQRKENSVEETVDYQETEKVFNLEAHKYASDENEAQDVLHKEVLETIVSLQEKVIETNNLNGRDLNALKEINKLPETFPTNSVNNNEVEVLKCSNNVTINNNKCTSTLSVSENTNSQIEIEQNDKLITETDQSFDRKKLLKARNCKENSGIKDIITDSDPKSKKRNIFKTQDSLDRGNDCGIGTRNLRKKSRIDFTFKNTYKNLEFKKDAETNFKSSTKKNKNLTENKFQISFYSNHSNQKYRNSNFNKNNINMGEQNVKNYEKEKYILDKIENNLYDIETNLKTKKLSHQSIKRAYTILERINPILQKTEMLCNFTKKSKTGEDFRCTQFTSKVNYLKKVFISLKNEVDILLNNPEHIMRNIKLEKTLTSNFRYARKRKFEDHIIPDNGKMQELLRNSENIQYESSGIKENNNNFILPASCNCKNKNSNMVVSEEVIKENYSTDILPPENQTLDKFNDNNNKYKSLKLNYENQVDLHNLNENDGQKDEQSYVFHYMPNNTEETTDETSRTQSVSLIGTELITENRLMNPFKGHESLLSNSLKKAERVEKDESIKYYSSDNLTERLDDSDFLLATNNKGNNENFTSKKLGKKNSQGITDVVNSIPNSSHNEAINGSTQIKVSSNSRNLSSKDINEFEYEKQNGHSSLSVNQLETINDEKKHNLAAKRFGEHVHETVRNIELINSIKRSNEDPCTNEKSIPSINTQIIQISNDSSNSKQHLQHEITDKVSTVVNQIDAENDTANLNLHIFRKYSPTERMANQLEQVNVNSHNMALKLASQTCISNEFRNSFQIQTKSFEKIELSTFMQFGILKPGANVLSLHTPRKIVSASLDKTGQIVSSNGKSYKTLLQWCSDVPDFKKEYKKLTNKICYSKIYYQGRTLSHFKNIYQGLSGRKASQGTPVPSEPSPSAPPLKVVKGSMVPQEEPLANSRENAVKPNILNLSKMKLLLIGDNEVGPLTAEIDQWNNIDKWD